VVGQDEVVIRLGARAAAIARPALLAVVVLDVVVSLLLVLVPYSASGSAQHSNAIVSVVFGCPQDEGEAVADGSSTVGAQGRCRGRGVLQLFGAAVGVGLAGVALAGWSQVVVRRASRYSSEWPSS
jgi:hypothetical protein